MSTSTSTKIVAIGGTVAALAAGVYLYRLNEFGSQVQTDIAGLKVEVVKTKGLMKTLRLTMALSVTNPTGLEVKLARPYIRLFKKSDPAGNVAISQPSAEETIIPARGTAQIPGLSLDLTLMDVIGLVSIKNVAAAIASLFSDPTKDDKQRVSALSAMLKEPLFLEYSTRANGIPYKAEPLRVL